jgi:hypothetical protein
MATATKKNAAKQAKQPNAPPSLVLISSLKPAKFNPPTRSKKDINGMITSLTEHGQLQSISLDKSNGLIDGHRRVAAAKKMGWTQLLAVRLSGDPAAVYAEINTQTKKHTGNDSLVIYLKNKHAVAKHVKTKADEALRILGRPLLQKLADAGMSLGPFVLARQIVTRAGLEGKKAEQAIVALVKYMFAKKNVYSVRQAHRTGSTLAFFLAAAAKNKDIRVKYAEK